MTEWFCTVGGQKYGPLSQQQVQAWIAEGRLTRTDMVWRQDMPQWMPAGQVSEFSPVFVAAAARQPRQGMSSGAIITIILCCVGGAILLIGGILAMMVLPALGRAREEARRIRCRNNLNQLAKGMATYLNECGDNRFYPWPADRPGCGTKADPDFGGAEWLASLYWTRIIPDPGVYNCPSSSDSNDQGMALGSFCPPGGRRLGKRTVSYAGMGDKSVGIYLYSKQNKGGGYNTSEVAIRDDFPPNEPMGSDDSDEPINHGEKDNGGMAVLFFDSHVEYWTHTRVDLELGVGAGDLCALRN